MNIITCEKHDKMSLASMDARPAITSVSGVDSKLGHSPHKPSLYDTYVIFLNFSDVQ